MDCWTYHTAPGTCALATSISPHMAGIAGSMAQLGRVDRSEARRLALAGIGG